MNTKQLAQSATTPANGKTKPEETKNPPIPVDFTEQQETAPEALPIEDRILKVQILGDLVEKREKLKESLKKLNSINAASESRDLRITIEDDRNEWETYNTDAVRACITAMRQTIETKLQEVESQIKF